MRRCNTIATSAITSGGSIPRFDACNGTPMAAASVTTIEISNNVY